ncbi:hypothetical protein HMPREF1977_1868 [Capnocytophaga ochracea F0287]|uniref:Uncharacterized protein n=1 Tax=Capnocytophaga ochracea F0287 TaxID=873517 RepID=E4MTZ6_CAPOC|nr:hypothetical protein [Capnocytophaga ochracea]EFS96952.1 hypothetical protein HMPREF1977_1868 [Capnocytophaga ochracea F0287]UEB42606.1 hypothetical protein LK419_07265 [Capnocytophaga ochracea]
MIYYSILAISVAYLIYILVMQGTTNLKREKSIEEKRQKWQNALVDEEYTKDRIMELIKSEYGEPTTSSVEKGVYTEGMPDFLVKMALGKPLEVQSAGFKGSTTERWHYKTLTLTFQNNKLIGWESHDNTSQKPRL